MKLLICTQVVDNTHPVLGFFHRWLEEFAKYYDEIHVICLEEGIHNLPDNVYVYSLGKEDGRSRYKYVIRLYKYIWVLRKKYDVVFVHMNEEFVILGAPIWRLLQKKVGHWRMHGRIDLRLYISRSFAQVIFTGADTSYPLPSKKLHIVGHGIDTERFAPQVCPKKYDIVTVGRISRSKNLERVIDVFESVRQHHDVSLTIVGKPITSDDKIYLHSIEDYVSEKGLQSDVDFLGAINNTELPKFLAQSKIFLHLATSGSYDKVLLESMAMSVPVVTTAWGARTLPIGKWYASSDEEAVAAVIDILTSDNTEKLQTLREYVTGEHNLSILIPKIVSQLAK